MYLWGLIRGIQFITFFILIPLNFPSNANLFLTNAMGIAQLDIYKGGAITGAIFNFSNEDPFVQHFGEHGIDDKNYFKNTGSLIWPIFIAMLFV